MWTLFKNLTRILVIISLTLLSAADVMAEKKGKKVSSQQKKSKKQSKSKSPIKKAPEKTDDENFKLIEQDLKAIQAMNRGVSVNMPGSVNSHVQSHSPEPPQPVTRIDVTDKGFLFKFPKRPGMSLVNIYGDFWLFFDEKFDFSKPTQFPMGLRDFQDYSTSSYSIYKIQVDNRYWPVISLQGHDWKIDFVTIPQTAKSKKIVNWPNRRDDPVKILIPSYTMDILWTHPVTKVDYIILTSRKYAGGFAPHEGFPQFDAVESYQGLGIIPKTDSLVVMKDGDGENVLIYDSFGIIPKPASKVKATIFVGNRSTLALTKEIEKLRSEKQQTPEMMLRQIHSFIKLGVFNEAGFRIKDLETVCQGKCNTMQAQLDLMKLMSVILSDDDENPLKKDTFTLHVGQGAEFFFWYNLYHKRPQNYEVALEHFIPKYPRHVRNRIVEILLSLPDENDNLEKLIKVNGLEERLVDRAKLKMALMPPISLVDLEALVKNSKIREIQGEALFELTKERRATGEWKAKDVIEKMVPFLFSYGAKEVEAKLFLANAYREVGDYNKAIRLLKEVLFEAGENKAEVDEKIKETYLAFFKMVTEGDSKKNPKPMDIIAFFNDFGQMNPEGEEGRKIIMAVVDSFQALSLLRPAIEVLSKYREGEKDEPSQRQMALRLAELHVENRNPEGGQKMLEIFGEPKSEDEVKKVTTLRVDMAILEGNPAKGLPLLEGKEDTFHLGLKQKILWMIHDFKGSFQVLKALVEKLETDKETRAMYTAHLAAVNVLMSPHPMTFEDMRIRYGHLVKGTDQETIFNVLTTPDQATQQGMRGFDDLKTLLTYVEGLLKKK